MHFEIDKHLIVHFPFMGTRPFIVHICKYKPSLSLSLSLSFAFSRCSVTSTQITVTFMLSNSPFVWQQICGEMNFTNEIQCCTIDFCGHTKAGLFVPTPLFYHECAFLVIFFDIFSWQPKTESKDKQKWIPLYAPQFVRHRWKHYRCHCHCNRDPVYKMLDLRVQCGTCRKHRRQLNILRRTVWAANAVAEPVLRTPKVSLYIFFCIFSIINLSIFLNAIRTITNDIAQ